MNTRRQKASAADLQQEGRPKAIYDLSNPAHITKLVSEQKGKLEQRFEWDYVTNRKSKTPKLYLAATAVLSDQLGVYAAEDIIVDKEPVFLGYYAGEKVKCGAENEQSLYIFDLVKGNKCVAFIDAELTRDWTAFLNSSQTPNVKAVTEVNEEGQLCIGFYATATIKKGKALLFNYGYGYFNSPVIKFKPLFLHPDDGMENDKDVFAANEDKYTNEVYSFVANEREKLGITAEHWLFPSIIKCIINNDYTELDKILMNGYPVDQFAYACNLEGEILNTSQQQHMTMLMYACYMGRKECIEVLLKHKADPNRCMLNSGHTPLTLLLIGKGDDEMVEDMALELLKKMPHPLIYDGLNLTPLHYAILRNSLALVDQLLQVAYQQENDIFVAMFDRKKNLPPHTDFDYCVLNNRFGILELLIEFQLQNNKIDFLDKIQKMLIFRNDTLKNASLEQLETLMEIFINDKKLMSKLKDTPMICNLQNQIDCKKVMAERDRLIEQLQKQQKVFEDMKVILRQELTDSWAEIDELRGLARGRAEQGMQEKTVKNTGKTSRKDNDEDEAERAAKRGRRQFSLMSAVSSTSGADNISTESYPGRRHNTS